MLRTPWDAARRIVAIAAAVLPVRHWSALDAHVPVTSSAIPSAILTFVAGAAVGLHGFLDHATALASAHNDALIRAATMPEGGTATTAMPVALTSLSVFTFLLMTPLGWASLYLCLTGFVRGLSAVCLDPRGDPVLSLVDRTAVATLQRARERRVKAARAAAEGPEVPDRVVAGRQLGLPHHDFVIVASRRKAGWDAGTVVLTDGAAYRVGTIEERQIGGRLRTLYPLAAHNDLEVFRRTVRYELPLAVPAEPVH